jgi:hypothetical protein
MNRSYKIIKVFLTTAIICLQTDLCWSQTQQPKQKLINLAPEFNSDRHYQNALSSNKSYFIKSPRLLDTLTTFSGVDIPYATYYFTIELPSDAGNSIQKIIINQRSGGEKIEFSLQKTIAFVGTHQDKQTEVKIVSVEEQEETNQIVINFASPIVPRTTFTIGLKPKRNPRYDGIYTFGVTAVPEGKQPRSLYLGLGRLHFYGGGDLWDE